VELRRSIHIVVRCMAGVSSGNGQSGRSRLPYPAAGSEP
jgi:hypothetical protein